MSDAPASLPFGHSIILTLLLVALVLVQQYLIPQVIPGASTTP